MKWAAYDLRRSVGFKSDYPAIPESCSRLLMDEGQERGVAGVLAHGVEERINADECHAETVAVDRVLERVESMVEFIDAKIIDADLVSRAGTVRRVEEHTGAHAPVGLPSVLLIYAKKSGGIEPWLIFVQRHQIVLHGLLVLTLHFIDETLIVVD